MRRSVGRWLPRDQASWHGVRTLKESRVILSEVERSETKSKNPGEPQAAGFFDFAALRSE